VGESIGVGDVGGGITAEMDEKRKRTNSSGLPRFLWNEGWGLMMGSYALAATKQSL
jgi:hypothetical protein